MSYSDYTIEGSASVSEALRKLESDWYKILFIAPDDELRGVVTDGNIRRFLLAGGSMDEPVELAANLEPVSLRGFHEGAARELLEKKQISCVPMLDERGKIHALVFPEETIHRLARDIDAPVIIMAGGCGTRLQPYTEILPKPLIPVGGVTITEQIMRRFKKFGCAQFSLVVNHKRSLIKSYFSEVASGRGLEFIDEEEPLGSGGGLSFFRGRFDRPVFVANCDSVVEADYADILSFHEKSGSLVTMVCCKKKLDIPYGVVEAGENGAISAIQEKPDLRFLTNTGLYVVSPEFIEMVPYGRFSPMTELIGYCLEMGEKISAYTVEDECFIDIGQLDDLKSVEGKLR
ncbi:MAG: sugar phosphate nucleotidyltransferase [Oscillospiraceae bacterium]|nr:sugar phosphate nucleotidyltransferase [Oscillospiraceae bacterium]